MIVVPKVIFRLLHVRETMRGVDQSHMGKYLRKVSSQTPGFGRIFLRKKTDVVFVTAATSRAALDVDQGDAQIGALLPAKMHHGLRDRDFKRGLNRT